MKPCIILLLVMSAACNDNPPFGPLPQDATPDTLSDTAPDTLSDTAPDTLSDTAPDTLSDTAPDIASPPPSGGSFVAVPTSFSEPHVFKGVWAGAAPHIVAVGQAGVIATHHPDGTWQLIPPTPRGDVWNAISGADPEHLWVVGQGGALRAGTTTTFSPTPSASPTTQTLWGIHVTSPTQAVAVGQAGTRLTLDNALWQLPSDSDTSLTYYGIAGHGDRLALVGAQGRAAITGPTGLTPVQTGVTTTLRAVFTPDGTTFFAVGDAGVLLVGSGTRWTRQPLPIAATDLLAISGTSPTSLVIVGRAGLILHTDDGTTWTQLESPTTSDLLAVSLASDGAITATGQHGVIIEGTAATGLHHSADLYPEGALSTLAATPDGTTLFAAGTQGKLFIRQDGQWRATPSPSSHPIYALFALSPADAWAVGPSGLILRWDGMSWTRTPSPTTAPLFAIWSPPAGPPLAAGGAGTLLTWDGTEWQSLAAQTTENLRAITSDAPNSLWAVGAQATILHWNGLGWGESPIDAIVDASGAEIPIEDELFGIWMASPTEGWAVGANGRILRWNGHRWHDHPSPVSSTLRALFGQAPDDVWAVGTTGQILHWNGVTWTPIPGNTHATLYAIHGDGHDHVVIVGDRGTVLKLQR